MTKRVFTKRAGAKVTETNAPWYTCPWSSLEKNVGEWHRRLCLSLFFFSGSG